MTTSGVVGIQDAIRRILDAGVGGPHGVSMRGAKRAIVEKTLLAGKAAAEASIRGHGLVSTGRLLGSIKTLTREVSEGGDADMRVLGTVSTTRDGAAVMDLGLAPGYDISAASLVRWVASHFAVGGMFLKKSGKAKQFAIFRKKDGSINYKAVEKQRTSNYAEAEALRGAFALATTLKRKGIRARKWTVEPFEAMQAAIGPIADDEADALVKRWAERTGR